MITLKGQSGTYSFDPVRDMLNSGKKFNTVYRGQSESHTPVLIKRLLPALANDPVAVNRFANEFHLRTTHPNIVPAIDYIIHHNEHFLVRNWIAGTDLSQQLHRTSPQHSLHIVLCVLKALAHLHQEGIIHLDVQPRNILVGTDRQVYLTDLGLARRITANMERQPFNISYSAPEQILNMQDFVNETTDLFAVGMIFLELLTRSRFQWHENPEVLMNLVLAAPVQNLHDLDEEVFRIIGKATGKPRFNLPPSHYSAEELRMFMHAAQQSRYRHAEEMIRDLSALPVEKLSRAPWWKLW